MSWIATMASVCISSRQASMSSFSVKGSPTWTVGRFSSEVGAELGRGHGGAVDAVATGFGADVDHRIADAGGGAEEDAVLGRDPDGHRVDQRVAVIGGVEVDLAADGRDADAVAVAADAANHAVHDPAGARIAGEPEAERVQVGDRARAHGEDIAEDAADAGGGTLIRLDEAGVIVALHLEDGGEPLADVDDSQHSRRVRE